MDDLDCPYRPQGHPDVNISFDDITSEEKIQRWIIIISTTKQAIRIQLSAMIGHDKFYLTPKFSVAFILN